MASDKQAYDGFLSAIEAKIAAWKAVADSYRAAMAIDGSLGDGPKTVGGSPHAAPAKARNGKASELPVGVFRDKTIKEAIVIYLEAVQRKQTNKEIAAGLQQGGIATTAKTFEATVATGLYRLKAEGVLLRFNDGWDLAASYPESLRGRLEKDRTPKTARKAKRKARVSKKRQPAESKTEDSATNVKPEPLRAVV